MGSFDTPSGRPGSSSAEDVSVTLPSPQAQPKKKITVTPADDSQLNLL